MSGRREFDRLGDETIARLRDLQVTAGHLSDRAHARGDEQFAAREDDHVAAIEERIIELEDRHARLNSEHGRE